MDRRNNHLKLAGHLAACGALLTALLLSPVPAPASSVTLSGVFTQDDNVQLFDFTVVAPDIVGYLSVDLRSYGYAGGTTSSGQTIPRGGFDTVLTLFSATGDLIADNDEGAGVAADPLTGLAADARITTNLASGNYILALTQFDSFANSSTLAGGFSEDGNPNFTADPTFTSGGSCAGNLFRDISGTVAGCRTGDWTAAFANVVSATARNTAVTPEPSTTILLGAGLFAFGLLSVWRKRSSAAPLLCLLLLSTVAVDAQTDFSQVGDLLSGKRQLLRDQDLVVGYVGNDNMVYYLNYLTANSKITDIQGQPTPCNVVVDRLHQVFSGRFYNADRDEHMTVCTDHTLGARVQLIDDRHLLFSPGFGVLGNTVFSAALADFSSTGYPDLAVNYGGGGEMGKLQLVSAANADGSRNLHLGNSGNDQPAETMLAMTAGDFNGDGRPEIAGLAYKQSGRPSLVIYSVDPKTLAVTKAAEMTPSYAGEVGKIANFSLTAGKFTDANHQQLVLAYATTFGLAKIVAFDFASGSLQPIEQKILSIQGTNLGQIQVEAARFFLQAPYDQVAFESVIGLGGSILNIYNFDKVNQTFKLDYSTGIANGGCASRMTVGNFDKKQIVGGKTQYDPSPQIAFAFGSCDNSTSQTLTIINVTPTGLSLASNFDTDSPFPFNSVYVTAADLQGRSYLLGEPTKLTLQGNIQPSVIAGMPPMHIDYVVPGGATKPEVLNFSAAPDGFNTSYQTSSESKVEGNNTNTISWSAGAKETVGASVSIGDPDVEGLQVKDTLTAAQELKGAAETQYGSFQGQSYSQSSTTGYGDFVLFSQNDFYVWIYPVLGKTVCPASIPNCSSSQALPMTIQFSAPGNTQIKSAGSAVPYWYQPPWEPGNIFSYPANFSQLQKIYPNIQPLSKQSDEWYTDTSTNTEQTTWNAGSSSGATSTLDQTYSFENDFSVAGSLNIEGLGLGGNYGLDLSGSYGLSSLHQSSTSVNESTGIGIQKKGGVADPNEYQYGITSYLIGRTKPGGVVDDIPLSGDVQTFDFLQAAFVADPLDGAAGAWWQQHYRDKPDVALNHPARWYMKTPALSAPIPPECLATGTGGSQMDCATKEIADPANPWGSPFYHMRGLFISSAAHPGQGPLLTQANAGSKLFLQARVYNYSFARMPNGTSVHVRFYAQPWDQMNNVALHGKNSFLVGQEAVLSPIPPFSDTPGAPLNWVLANTTFDTTGYDSQFLTFWVVVWMQNADGTLVPETADHGLHSIPGTLTSFDQVQTEDYSNNLGFWKLAFYVAPQGANSIPRSSVPPAELNIGKIRLSADRVLVDQPITVSALLSAEGQSASNVAAFFWDENPHRTDAAAFSLETASYIASGDKHQVSAIYRPKTCGTHQVFITVGKDTPNAVIRRSAPIQVDCGAANR